MTLPVALSRETVARWLEATPFDSHADADYLGMADAVLALLSAERRRVAEACAVVCDIEAARLLRRMTARGISEKNGSDAIASMSVEGCADAIRALAPVEVRA